VPAKSVRSSSTPSANRIRSIPSARASCEAGRSIDDYAGRIDGAVESSVRFGITDGDVKDALAKLTDATRDFAAIR